jgi:hypothetical protein
VSCASPSPVVSLQEAEAARVAAAAQAEAARKAAEAEAARKAAEAATALTLVCMPPPMHGMRCASPYVVPLRAGQLLRAVGGYMRARTPAIRTALLLWCRCCI